VSMPATKPTAVSKRRASPVSIHCRICFPPTECLQCLDAVGWAAGMYILSRGVTTVDDREISFLFQRLSVLIQRYNAILLRDCFVKEEEE